MLATLACLVSFPAAAELVVTNARIWTDGHVIKADTIAVAGGRITYVGASTPDLVGPKTKVVNADQHLLIPGLIDSHTHLVEHGDTLLQLRLQEASSKEDFIQRVKEYAKGIKPGKWIVGRGWSAEGWPGKEQPTKEWIDPVTGDRPTVLRRMDGHSALVNTAALVHAHIDKDAPADPPGGVIDRDPLTHEPTGILRDNALDLIEPPASTPYELYQGLLLAVKQANSHGVTAVSDIGEIKKFEIWRRYMRDEKPTIRVSLYGDVDETWSKTTDELLNFLAIPGWLEAKGIKIYLDGSLGSRTAYMHEQYTKPLPDQKDLRGVPRPGLTNGSYAVDIPLTSTTKLQVIAHAIGDQANHDLLDIYSKIQGDHRFRIEHAQHLLPEDIARFAQFNVIPSMQPFHKADDGRYADDIIGPERTKTSYAYRSLLDAGAKLAFGSDWPVVTIDPFAGINTAVTGKILTGAVWHPEQNITFDEALTCYTANGAFAMKRETDLGRIAVDYRADFVILNEWPYEKGFDYAKLQPTSVYVGGRLVYAK